jgi:hypothetical protein
MDVWHLDHLDPRRVRYYIEGCRAVGLQPLLSGVLPPDDSMAFDDPFPDALVELLREYGVRRSECLDVYTWAHRRAELGPVDRDAFDRLSAAQRVLVAWQPLTGEGRAVHLEVSSRPFAETAPEPCGAAGELPTIDEGGRLFPCCAPWVSRKDHALATVDGANVGDELARMRRNALVRVIHDRGPQVLVEHFRERGYDFPLEHSGICNQCGMLLDAVPLEELQCAAKELLSREPVSAGRAG